MTDVQTLLKQKLTAESFEKIAVLKNEKLYNFIADAIELANPDSVYVCDDSPEDTDYIRSLAIDLGEENPLATKGHTYHFDGYNDQARDKAKTKYLLPPGSDLGESLNSIDKATGVDEVRSFLKNSMQGRQMLVCFFCLGPTGSQFAIPCAQITDSPYVAHSEFILYRKGYEQFKQIGDSPAFFRFLHSEGELENYVSKNVDKRRVYIDLEENFVYSVNTQYGGNTIGLKKLSRRAHVCHGSSWPQRPCYLLHRGLPLCMRQDINLHASRPDYRRR
ncbi:MAG: hypothetical protein ACYSUK_05580 [Planctomycetota bacterium]|jgi:phosphoenolpyruvate carboxykinase (GTP)